MAEQYQPNLGYEPELNARRDAVHIAVAPVVAGEGLDPGWHVYLKDGLAYGHSAREPGDIGIVDPFLPSGPDEGQRFWIVLYPGTITGLRHLWRHEAFDSKPHQTKRE